MGTLTGFLQESTMRYFEFIPPKMESYGSKWIISRSQSKNMGNAVQKLGWHITQAHIKNMHNSEQNWPQKSKKQNITILKLGEFTQLIGWKEEEDEVQIRGEQEDSAGGEEDEWDRLDNEEDIEYSEDEQLFDNKNTLCFPIKKYKIGDFYCWKSQSSLPMHENK